MDKRQYGIFSLPVIVGALGFFVDVYDLLLFNIIRKPSLQDLGLSGDAVLTAISIPNSVRGFLPLIILLFIGLRSATGDFVKGGWITGIIIMAVAVIAAWFTHESFGKDMNFLEV